MDERGGEIVGTFGDPGVDALGGEPGAVFDFFGLKLEGAFVGRAIDPDEFLAGLFAGVELEEAIGLAGELDAELFADFAEGAGVVVFAAVEVAGG